MNYKNSLSLPRKEEHNTVSLIFHGLGNNLFLNEKIMFYKLHYDIWGKGLCFKILKKSDKFDNFPKKKKNQKSNENSWKLKTFD